MKTPACYALTRQGALLARRIAGALGGTLFAPERLNLPDAQGFRVLSEQLARNFHVCRGHIFIGAAGVVLRCIAPLLTDKRNDPAVVVCDQRGRHAVSLLGGHLGGANALAEQVAAVTGGRAVITTASDVEGLPALDVLARDAGCAAADPAEMRQAQTALLEEGSVYLIDPLRVLPEHEALIRPDDPRAIPDDAFRITVDWRRLDPAPRRLRLIAPLLCAGVGCRKAVPAGDILAALDAALSEAGAAPAALALIASADIKKREAGLREAAGRLKLPLRFFTGEELARVPVPNPSRKAGEVLALTPLSVCEGAALLAAGGGSLLLEKRVLGGVTVALAPIAGRAADARGETPPRKDRSRHEIPPVRPAPLRVVGLGPGDAGCMTAAARAALEASRVIAGYSLYVDLVPPELLAGKERITTGMRRETDRCNAAIDAALEGRATALVCSGDAGIYGMAGLVFELMEQRGLGGTPPVEIIPGVPALCAAAALLGAPLMHDFACVSLSDLLTPLELIMRRLAAALRADFVLTLYNPRSRGRPDHLDAALALAREARGPDTPVGLVRLAHRKGQESSLHRLEDFDAGNVDMLSLVIIGNSSTRCVNGRMVTPRGYALTPGKA